MNNQTALSLAVALVAVFLLDQFVFEWDLHIILTRRMVQLTDVMAFWR